MCRTCTKREQKNIKVKLFFLLIFGHASLALVFCYLSPGGSSMIWGWEGISDTSYHDAHPSNTAEEEGISSGCKACPASNVQPGWCQVESLCREWYCWCWSGQYKANWIDFSLFNNYYFQKQGHFFYIKS